MSKRKRLPANRISVEDSGWHPGHLWTVWLYIDRFDPMPVRDYPNKRDAIRGAYRLQNRVGGDFKFNPKTGSYEKEFPVFVESVC